MAHIHFLIPTLNEEDGIRATIDSIPTTELIRRGHEVNITIVDGKSTDKTTRVAKSLGAKVISEGRKGYGRAYKSGLAKITGDVIVTGDADGTYPFEMVPDAVDQFLSSGDDFWTFNRFSKLGKGAMTPKHKLGNFILSTTMRVLYLSRVKDSQSGMWFISPRAAEVIQFEKLSDGMAFSQEIKIEAFRATGLSCREVPGSLVERIGVAKIESWGDGFGNLKQLFIHRFQKRAS